MVTVIAAKKEVCCQFCDACLLEKCSSAIKKRKITPSSSDPGQALYGHFVRPTFTFDKYLFKDTSCFNDSLESVKKPCKKLNISVYFLYLNVVHLGDLAVRGIRHLFQLVRFTDMYILNQSNYSF